MKYLVDFHHGTSDQDIQSYLASNGCTVLKEWDNFDKVFLVECASEPPVTSIIERITDDEDHLAIKPLDIYINKNWLKSVVPGLPEVTIQTSGEDDWWKNYVLQNPVFDQPTATISRKGSNVSVYIMDSGIKADHPDLDGVSITNVYSVVPGDFSDTNGHGTALASLISGKTAGITSASIKVVRIFAQGHNTLQSEFISACDAILNDFQPNTLAILNCSFTIPKNEYIESKLRQLNNAGIFIMAAAGNSGTSIEDTTPACMPEALTIGAFNSDLLPCSFSNYTSVIANTENDVNHGELDIWAPGANIRVATLDGGFGMASGTSAATAIASAVLAFNIHDFIHPVTGERISGYHDAPLMPLSADMMFAYSHQMGARVGLLDLSDPKYAASTNRIVTIIQNADTMPNASYTDLCLVRAKIGEASWGPNFFDKYRTVSIDVLEPLPENFEINPNGQIFGTPTAEQGPGPNESYKLYTAKIKVNYDDGTFEDKDINLYVTRPDFQPSEVPEDHPLAISLQFNNCMGYSTYCGVVIAVTCNDYCTIFCCNMLFKGSPCVCA